MEKITDTVKNLYGLLKACDKDPFDPYILQKEYTFSYSKNDPEVENYYREAVGLLGNLNQYNQDQHTGVRIVIRLMPDPERFYQWVEINLTNTYITERFNQDNLKTSYAKLGINIKKLKREYLNTYKTVEI